mmetsp:Transcript_37193/g.80980  ORF Transcript_37193/g.80980 Transcript_37193/m.80980 type:complete len:284 (+) Transcript_37193:428-1279(+)
MLVAEAEHRRAAVQPVREVVDRGEAGEAAAAGEARALLGRAAFAIQAGARVRGGLQLLRLLRGRTSVVRLRGLGRGRVGRGRLVHLRLLLRHLLVLLPLRQDELLAELRLLLRLRGQAVCLRDGLYLGQRHGVPAAFPRRPPLVPRRLVQDPGRPRSGVGASLARAPRRRAAGGAPRARGAAAEQGSSVGAERWAGGRASGGSPAAGILVHRAPTATGALLGHLQRRPDQRGRVEDGRGRGASGRGGRATPSHGGGCRRAVGRNGALYRAMSLLPLPLLELAA